MLLKLLFSVLGIILGALIGFFGVYFICVLIDYWNSPKPGSGAGSVGWVFTFFTIPIFAILGCIAGLKLAALWQ